MNEALRNPQVRELCEKVVRLCLHMRSTRLPGELGDIIFDWVLDGYRIDENYRRLSACCDELAAGRDGQNKIETEETD
ncbi:Uncharacterised protein [Alistipes sp. cv1]|uniref:hypothetical protein n=1 Tax=Alistipes indistinctus TaxID=626932 RepID=UPI0006C0C402|nr:Uncharacterised protein [Faecalibacterium prausnitzii]